MERVSPTQMVYDYIIDKILTKQWKPNQKISTESQLSLELEVSRTTIRQALERLTAVGLLIKKQGAGTFVSNYEASSVIKSLIPIILLEKKELRSLLEFRIHFESGNVELFMQYADEEDIEKLEYHYKKMVENKDNTARFYLEDFNFHSVIANGTKNPFTIRISELLNEVLKNHQAHLYKDIGPEVGLEFHKEILDAIRENDKELAVLKIKRHLEATIVALGIKEKND